MCKCVKMSFMEQLFIIAILLVSVVIHEVSHGYAALWLGDPTAKLQGRLTLNPIKHIDPFGSIILPLLLVILPGNFILGWAKPVEYNPYNFKKYIKWGEGIVAASGPAVNILIAIIFSLIIRFSDASASFLQVSAIVVLINLILAFFNLIPIPPLDGSKILFTILPRSLSHLRVTMERYSFFLIIILILFFWDAFIPVVFGAFRLLTGMGVVL